MKVILTGSTGFIGGEVLLQTLAHPSITSVIALTRRELSTVELDEIDKIPGGRQKLEVLIVKDFMDYGEEIVGRCQGAGGCIWSLGTAKLGPESVAINVDYTLSAAETFQSRVVSTRADKTVPFRFMYLSGFLAEKDQARSLWVLSDMRKKRGELETSLLSISSKSDEWDTFVARPGFVLAKTNPLPTFLVNRTPTVGVSQLAAAMINIVVKGTEGAEGLDKEGGGWLLENDASKKWGEKLLKTAR